MSEWIIVRNWERFQHYRDRSPAWIKLYTELRDSDEWRALTLAQQGLLVNVWVLFAASDGQLTTKSLPSRIPQRVRRESLDSLTAAGFIELSASKPLAHRYQVASPEKEKRRERPTPTPSADAEGDQDEITDDLAPRRKRRRLSARELRAYTGCRFQRGSHGATHVRDVLGTERPPPDWPWPPPSREEIEGALHERTEAQ